MLVTSVVIAQNIKKNKNLQNLQVNQYNYLQNKTQIKNTHVKKCVIL